MSWPTVTEKIFNLDKGKTKRKGKRTWKQFRIYSLQPFLTYNYIIMCRPHICHNYHKLYLWRKICHVEKFQISVKNLNIFWSFIKICAVCVLNLCGENLCGEKMTNMRSDNVWWIHFKAYWYDVRWKKDPNVFAIFLFGEKWNHWASYFFNITCISKQLKMK